jgi:hypothetical protein
MGKGLLGQPALSINTMHSAKGSEFRAGGHGVR